MDVRNHGGIDGVALLVGDLHRPALLATADNLVAKALQRHGQLWLLRVGDAHCLALNASVVDSHKLGAFAVTDFDGDGAITGLQRERLE